MNKKVFATIGMIVSIVIVVMGVLVMTGAMGGNANYPSSAPYSYDSGYATFGGDFYTYVNNNASEAASASRTAASNIRALCELLKNFCGIALIGLGLIGLCAFGIQRCNAAEAALPAPVATLENPQVEAAPAAEEPEATTAE